LPFRVFDPIAEGRVGTGGTEPKELPLEKRDPNVVETRREGEAIVA
jgi:hypothetical protein